MSEAPPTSLVPVAISEMVLLSKLETKMLAAVGFHGEVDGRAADVEEI